MENTIYGYARVFSTDQNEDQQMMALKNVNVEGLPDRQTKAAEPPVPAVLNPGEMLSERRCRSQLREAAPGACLLRMRTQKPVLRG